MRKVRQCFWLKSIALVGDSGWSPRREDVEQAGLAKSSTLKSETVRVRKSLNLVEGNPVGLRMRSYSSPATHVLSRKPCARARLVAHAQTSLHRNTRQRGLEPRN